MYLIVVEDYGSPRTLSQYLDVHDDGFFDWLTSSGFKVLPIDDLELRPDAAVDGVAPEHDLPRPGGCRAGA